MAVEKMCQMAARHDLIKGSSEEKAGVQTVHTHTKNMEMFVQYNDI
jgi:hypothetical protein